MREEEAMKPPSRHHPPCAVIVKSCFKDSRSMSQALHHPLPSWCVPSIPGIERSLFTYTTNDIFRVKLRACFLAHQDENYYLHTFYSVYSNSDYKSNYISCKKLVKN
ncbi:hypothetical protein RchiOBHm_Chr1g0364761 [Rosa chinensis]|uniref:Uncharacterized protein n=1 Tax=Rosa chinensis TaxID=74649 RepID=A0A2P6SJU7_ROSCH|nr:hypothetical protein RchiOBHm_Chr1g0364761 [Rosa chinensis]